MSNWISTVEQLPPENKTVILVYKSCDGKLISTAGYYSTWPDKNGL